MTRAALLVLALLLLSPLARAEGEHRVFWTPKQVVAHHEGTLAEGEERTFRFLVIEPNVTRISFLVEWAETGDAAGVTRLDRFALTLRDPQGAAVGQTVRSDSGAAFVASPLLHAVPDDRDVPAKDLERVLAEEASAEGQGKWALTLRLEDAGNAHGLQVDQENAYRLRIVLETYEGVPMKVVSLASPQPVSLSSNGSSKMWPVALLGTALLACALAVALACQGLAKQPKRFLPRRDNTDSLKK